MERRPVLSTQSVCRMDVALPVARLASQRVLRVRVYKSASAHREVVTDDGITVTDNGEEVWVMVPDV